MTYNIVESATCKKEKGLNLFPARTSYSQLLMDKFLRALGRFHLHECRTLFAFTICFGFALLRLVIGLKTSHHFLNQSEVKPKPIVAC